MRGPETKGTTMRRKNLLGTTLLGTTLLRTILIGLFALSGTVLTTGTASAAGPISLTSGFYVNPGSNPAVWVSGNPADPRAASIRSSIASRPIARWFTGNESGGVGPAVSGYVGAAASHDLLPVLVAYDIPLRDACGGQSSGGAASVSDYHTWISTFAAAVGSRPAVVVIEPDALADFSCLTAAQTADRLAMLQYATRMFQQKAPNTWAYLDAGHAGWIDVATMASRLNSAGVHSIRGFALNVSSFRTTAESESYGNSIDSALGGTSPFVVDTSRNGNGSNGEWCNPSGRRLGVPPQVGAGADLLLWIKTPGNSDGECGIAPTVPAGQFSPDLATRLIAGT